MGSFLSTFSSAKPADELELQLWPKDASCADPIDRYSGRRHPLNPNGHFTSNLLTSSFRLRRRRRTNTQTHPHIQALESPSADESEPGTDATTSDGSAQVNTA